MIIRLPPPPKKKIVTLALGLGLTAINFFEGGKWLGDIKKFGANERSPFFLINHSDFTSSSAHNWPNLVRDLESIGVHDAVDADVKASMDKISENVKIFLTIKNPEVSSSEVTQDGSSEELFVGHNAEVIGKLQNFYKNRYEIKLECKTRFDTLLLFLN